MSITSAATSSSSANIIVSPVMTKNINQYVITNVKPFSCLLIIGLENLNLDLTEGYPNGIK